MWQNWKSDKKIEKIKTIDKIENLTKLKIWQSWKTDKIESASFAWLVLLLDPTTHNYVVARGAWVVVYAKEKAKH